MAEKQRKNRSLLDILFGEREKPKDEVINRPEQGQLDALEKAEKKERQEAKKRKRPRTLLEQVQ